MTIDLDINNVNITCHRIDDHEHIRYRYPYKIIKHQVKNNRRRTISCLPWANLLDNKQMKDNKLFPIVIYC